ncbi:MAG: glycoside hydrolase family 2, partial [Cyclobacteriaceae bacterium]|nr:glycoside hydrolase family 2 [Cyclobacteriaceae bacterium]
YFEVDNLPEMQELFINLGKVGVMAKVMVNSIDIGTTWIAPYRLNVTECLKEGKNTIEIEVVNLWRNRLLKDRQLPMEERYTWHLVDDIKDGEEPQPSGLIGPVRIEYY